MNLTTSQSALSIPVMKTKVISVESINRNHIFDPDLVKYEFRHKINTRLSGLHHQMKRSGLRDSALRSRKSPSQPKYDTSGKADIFKKDNISSEELIHFINVAMKLQQNIYEASVATNEAHSIQLLLIFLESYLSLIFNFYYMIAVIIVPQTFKLPRIESIVYLSQHLLLPSVYVVVPVIGFAMLKAAFLKSMRIVNKIIIYVHDSNVRLALLVFSQQIQANIPDFNIFGFFSLDGSVIFAMISSSTTYLIILVQALGEPETQSMQIVTNKTV